MNNWAVLILSLPTENATVRMRAWRALKSSGAAVLRDGVYLLPGEARHVASFQTVADDILANGGQAFMLACETPAQSDFKQHFDRGAEYAALLDEIRTVSASLSEGGAMETARQVRKLRKTFGAISLIDFFAGEARNQAGAALENLESALNALLSPGEPKAAARQILRLNPADYQGRVWATRRRPWVDRLACAWLIRRFIDPEATIRWLAQPSDCPKKALGFDFDGATFTHVDAKVSFEVLLASFGFDKPALQRIAAIVHYLDVGGVPPPEAAGVESVLAGLRESIADDDLLLLAADAVFDGLLFCFEKSPKT